MYFSCPFHGVQFGNTDFKSSMTCINLDVKFMESKLPLVKIDDFLPPLLFPGLVSYLIFLDDSDFAFTLFLGILFLSDFVIYAAEGL